MSVRSFGVSEKLGSRLFLCSVWPSARARKTGCSRFEVDAEAPISRQPLVVCPVLTARNHVKLAPVSKYGQVARRSARGRRRPAVCHPPPDFPKKQGVAYAVWIRKSRRAKDLYAGECGWFWCVRECLDEDRSVYLLRPSTTSFILGDILLQVHGRTR